jgi:hypothetical protein
MSTERQIITTHIPTTSSLPQFSTGGKKQIIHSLFTVLGPAQEFFIYKYGDITIAGEGLQNLGLCSSLRALSREGSLSCHTYCDTGPWFFRSHPFIRTLRHARGCWGPILTWILTGATTHCTTVWPQYHNHACKNQPDYTISHNVFSAWKHKVYSEFWKG